MKTKLLMFFVLLLGVGATFTSCGDNDEQDDGQWIDPVFARYLETNGYIKDAAIVTPVEVSDITTLEIDSDIITSLKGIELFISLKVLSIGWCENLTNLNVSRNAQLEELRVTHTNKLKHLDVSKNKNLKTLWCYVNESLEQVNVSGCTELEFLFVTYSKLNRLDVTNNKKLTRLDCNNNNMIQLDISNNRSLESFCCHDNPGVNGQFRVKAWFDNDSRPNFGGDFEDTWEIGSTTVSVYFYK